MISNKTEMREAKGRSQEASRRSWMVHWTCHMKDSSEKLKIVPLDAGRETELS